jgi:hypothetical protein
MEKTISITVICLSKLPFKSFVKIILMMIINIIPILPLFERGELSEYIYF